MVRLYSLVEAIAAIGIVAGGGFWFGLLFDWLLEPSPTVRVGMWVVVAAAGLYAAWRYAGRRALASLPDESLALLVERKFPHLSESLVTTVQARGDGGRHRGRFARQMIDLTSQRAAAEMSGLDLRKVFDLRPLGRKLAVASLIALSITGFAAWNREAMAFWQQRMLLSEELWPRRVQLTVVQFEDREASPAVNVAREDQFDLTVLASLKDGHEAPAEVEVRWRRPSDGGRGGGPMLRIGDAQPGNEVQQYRYTFKVGSDLEFDVIGGDDRIRNLRLRAVERPAITQVWLDCDYPKYMQRARRTIAVSGRAELPEGASCECRMVANKPLTSVVVRDGALQVDVPARIMKESPHEFSFFLPPSSSDRLLLVTVLDADGVENRDPFRLPLLVVPDQPPEVSVQLRGIGSAVTPQAMIPFIGRLTDDYGLTEAWFQYRVNEQASERLPFRSQPEGMMELRMTEVFDLTQSAPGESTPILALRPGQKLALSVAARDAYDLGDEPHVGRSQRFAIDVVTASELRALLEKRELGLRQRFESVYDKMTGVRELLDRIDLAPNDSEADDTDSGAEASDEAADRAVERASTRVAGLRQSSTELAYECSGVAEGFDDIVAELINNRVDTEELKQRLEGGIAEPLKTISGEMLPRFGQRLELLQQSIETQDPSSLESLTAAKSEAYAVADAMKAVLDRMLELESYNELVDLLRGIVEDQDQIRAKTQEQQRQKLRELLE